MSDKASILITLTCILNQKHTF